MNLWLLHALQLAAPLLLTAQGASAKSLTSRQSNESAVVALHRSLCTIDSTSGKEADLSTWLVSYLKSHDWTVETQAVAGATGRNNIYAYLGESRAASILLSSHIDTVPPFFAPTYHANGTITGRGANDAKGSVAAQIIAAHDLIESGDLKAGDISLLYVVGEEVGGEGMVAANALNLTWKAGIFGEPTESKLSRGHKGILRFNLEAFGVAAHSAYPELGVDANAHLVDALEWLRWHVDYPESELLGPTTVNFGLMAGGTAANIISPYANASVSIRLVDTVENTKRVFDRALKRFEKVGVNHTYFGTFYDPVIMDADVEGFEYDVQAYGTDVPKLLGDHKKYLYGPGSIHTAHSPAEFVTVSDLEEAVEGYKKLIVHNIPGAGNATANATAT